jgi:arylsulfatase A-like enzyme
MQKQPNVVIFFTDDQRFDTIAALGNDEIITPNIDRLVSEGTTFTRAHIPCGTSGAVCMPSRAMLHTGRTLFHLEGAGQGVPENHALMGETFQKAGYTAFGTGKWHNGPRSYARSFSTGGEVMFGGMADHWNVPMCRFDPSGRYPAETMAINDPFVSNREVTRIVDHVNFGVHSTDTLSDFSVDFIRGYDGDDPLFVYIAFLAPHDPRSMPEKFRTMYDPAKIALPESFTPEHPFEFGMKYGRDEMLAPYPRTEEDTRRQIAEYYAMITHLDDGIGRVMKALEEKGEYENTIFVFAGDNGLAVGRHGLFGKQNHYEHSVRVPLIFAGPGIPRGEKRDEYAYLLDIYPTLCDMLGFEIPATVEGNSLKGIIAGGGKPVREDLYFALTDLMRSYKDDRYKLILYSFGDENHVQLFDLVEDPQEMKDLSSDASTGDTVTRLYDNLARYRDDWDDQASEWGRRFWARFERNGGLGV